MDVQTQRPHCSCYLGVDLIFYFDRRCRFEHRFQSILKLRCRNSAWSCLAAGVFARCNLYLNRVKVVNIMNYKNDKNDYTNFIATCAARSTGKDDGGNP